MPPPTGSMRITSAPNCAIVMPPKGAATKAENSTIRKSASSRFIAAASFHGFAAIEDGRRRRRNRRGGGGGSGAGDQRAHRVGLGLDLVQPAFHQIANADDPAE